MGCRRCRRHRQEPPGPPGGTAVLRHPGKFICRSVRMVTGTRIKPLIACRQPLRAGVYLRRETRNPKRRPNPALAAGEAAQDRHAAGDLQRGRGAGRRHCAGDALGDKLRRFGRSVRAIPPSHQE